MMIITSPAHAASGPTSLTLAWNPSPDASVTGYHIHYGVASGQYPNNIPVGNATTYSLTGLTPGVLYYFSVTAHNAAGVQSPFSNEITFMLGGAQLRLQATPSRQMQLTLAGQPGHIYNIEASPDMKTWSVIGTVNPGADGSASFTDVNAASFPRRFYRLRDTTP